jgi:glycosyltransferase involved in cell wall biosynthesis
VHDDATAPNPVYAGSSCAFIQFEEMFAFPAHTVHILMMCDALTTLGVATTLFMHPPSESVAPAPSELAGLYGLGRMPQISWVARDSNKWVARFRQAWESARLGRRFTYAYTTRGLPALGALLGGGRHVVLEIHQPPEFWSRHDRLAAGLARRSQRLQIVCISASLAEIMARHWGIDPSSIIVEHSGHNFPIRDDYRADSAAGRRLRALYVGSFDPGKGLQTIFDVAALHPGIDFVAVGGSAPEGRLPDNVSVEARVAHGLVPDLLSRADILIMPFTTYRGDSGQSVTEEFYSPLKMVEYLSAGRAIISSNLPSIAEVLVDESNCLLVDPDSISLWSTAVGRLESDAALRERLAHGAAHAAERHTVLERARRILEGIGGTS